MYEKIVGEKVKIVHEDGSRIIVTYGIVEEYDPEIKTISINTLENHKVYINAKNIQKLEVMELGN